ncbi:MAG: hypothetical protein ACR2JY_22210 [Chloroflexota bacterium]
MKNDHDYHEEAGPHFSRRGLLQTGLGVTAAAAAAAAPGLALAGGGTASSAATLPMPYAGHAARSMRLQHRRSYFQ